MKKRIVIAGAGPGGLLLGRELATAGMEVTIYEAMEKEAYFDRYHWSDSVYLNMLTEAGLPVPRANAKGDRWEGYGVKGENSGLDLYERSRITGFGVYAPDYSTKAVNDADLRVVLTDRAALQRYQCELAEKAGVKIQYGSRITGLLGKTDGALGEIDIKGVVVEAGGEASRVEADLVVDATGQIAALRTMIAAPEINQPSEPIHYGYAYRSIRRVDSTDIDPVEYSWDHPPVRHHFRYRTTEGYLFAHTLDETHLDVAGCAVTVERAKAFMEEYFSKIPGVHEEVGGAVEQFLKPVPPSALVAGGFLVVGHAAVQVNPTNACGIAQAFMGALLAAQVIKKVGEFSIHELWEYSYRWMSGTGAHFAALGHRMTNLSVEDVIFLLRHDILNGELRTYDYQGLYVPTDLNDERKLEAAYRENPKLVSRWLKAEGDCQAVLACYQRYPAIYSSYAMARWRLQSPFIPLRAEV